MEYAGDLYGSGTPIIRDTPVFGAGANIERGAVIIRGATPGTNGGFAILGTGAMIDVLGILSEQHVNTVTGDDSNMGGTNLTLRKAIVNPFAVWKAEYSQAAADDIDVVSTATTTVTITDLEDNIDHGWLYATAGTGVGRLTLLTASASGSATSKETTGWDSTTKVIKILPQWHQLGLFNATVRNIASAAAAGTAEICVLDNYIQADDIPLTRLNNITHSGLTGLNSRNVRFFAHIIFRNHAFNTLE